MDPVPPTLTNGMASDAAACAQPTSLFPHIPHAKQRALLVAYAHCLQLTAACAQAGISRQTHYDWLHQNPVYAAAFATAQQMGVDWLEDVAIKRATEGAHPSDVLLMFLLKAARPDKYREAQRRDESRDISELLKAVLLEMHERSSTRDITPEADWAPLPPGAWPSQSQRPPLPAPPGLDDEEPR